ncbi:lamin tail domain-containing protein [Thermococcus sp.]
MKIKNARWNGTDLIFEIWWYDGINPVAVKTYLWRNPMRALQLVRQMKSGSVSENALKEAFTVEPLTVSHAVRIEDVDYLTNDGSGEYVFLYNPGLSKVALSGWYIMDEYAYNNSKCWINNTIPRGSCRDSYGRNHVVRFSVTIPPKAVVKVRLAGSPHDAVLNNDGDTVYLVDDKGYLEDIYSYAASPEITVEGVSYSPNPVREGDYLNLEITLDNRGALDGTGEIEVYVDGKLVKSTIKTVWRYHVWKYRMYGVWRATPGTHVLTVKFVPQYGGKSSSKSITFKVSALKPYISKVTHGTLVEGYPSEFHVDVVNPARSRKDVLLKLFVDGAEVDSTTGYVYKKWSFSLYWNSPEEGLHDVEIRLYDESGAVIYSQWASTVYFRPNTPPRIESVKLPPWIYAKEWSNGTIKVYDSEGDLVNVRVNVVGRFSFTRSGLSPGVTHGFPLAPIYNHTNCRENITLEFTPTDQYGMTGETVTKVLTVVTDSDKDGWCNALELEYGTNPRNNDTDGDGVIDSKDVDPRRDAKITVYILRARALDDVDSSIIGHNPADMSLELTVNGQTKTLLLTDNQDDYEKKIIPTINPLANLQSYAIATATFDVPDDKELATIRFHLYDRDSKDGSERDEMDVSPGEGTVATVYYNLKTGMWSGDDYPGDEEKYFGYGHLSGCGDGSCNVGPKEPDKDLKVYVKYEGILEKAGIKGEIIGMKTIEGVSDVTVKEGTTTFSIVNPKSLKVVEVRLENGTVINVTLVNTYGAKLTSPGNDVVAMENSPGSAEISSNESIGNDAVTFKGDIRAVTSSGEIPVDSNLVVTYSSDREEKDGEIWFIVTINDGDGIPFYREIELNRELEANGFTARFDPTDKNNADMNGDYDGDGVPNAVEQLIGKDPAKRDILGIELNVSVEWKISDEDKEKLIYSIRKASDFIYDYTDGYAMITRVNIWDGKRNWDKADVRVHDEVVNFWERDSDAWPQATVGGYWIRRDSRIDDKNKTEVHIELPKAFGSLLRNIDHLEEYIQTCSAVPNIGACVLAKLLGDKAKMGSVDYGRAIAHELGHYVFILGDEYMDWHGKIYYNPQDYGIRDSLWFYRNSVPPHSIMNNAYKYSELSWPADYERFNETLSTRFKKKWYEHFTDQWGRWKECSRETLSHLLSGNLQFTFRMDNSTVTIRPNRAGIEFLLSDTPNTGPYTGVGYFMEVSWR